MREVRQVVVLEGPAGSGKTTLADCLQRDGRAIRAPLPVEFERPRAYLGHQGIQLAMLKDRASALSFAACPVQSKPILVDRWYISGWVYDTLRRGKGSPTTQDFHFLYELVYSGMSNAANAQLEYYMRTADMKHMPPMSLPLIKILMVFVLPGSARIQIYRLRSGQHYPYDVDKELSLYHQAYHHLDNFGEIKFGPVVFSPVLFVYDRSVDDNLDFDAAYQQLLKQISWMR